MRGDKEVDWGGRLEVEERSRFQEWRAEGEVQALRPRHSCPLLGLCNPRHDFLSAGLRGGAQRNQIVCVNQMAKCKRNQMVTALFVVVVG